MATGSPLEPSLAALFDQHGLGEAPRTIRANTLQDESLMEDESLAAIVVAFVLFLSRQIDVHPKRLLLS